MSTKLEKKLAKTIIVEKLAAEYTTTQTPIDLGKYEMVFTEHRQVIDTLDGPEEVTRKVFAGYRRKVI